MSETEYFKFIVGDDVESQRRLAILKKGIENAKKRADRPGYRFSARQRMISHIKDREYEGA